MSSVTGLLGTITAAGDFTKRALFSKSLAPVKGIIAIDTLTKGKVFGPLQMNDIAYNGSIYVGCSGNVVYSSTDLITWTIRTPAGFTNSRWLNVTWNATLGLFMLTGIYSAANTSWTCNDGVTWVKKATLTAQPDAIFSGLGYFMAYTASTGAIYRTTDGTTWTLATTIALNVSAVHAAETNGMLFIKYCNALGVIVYHNYYMTGTTWAQFGGNSLDEIFAVIYYSGLYYYFHVNGSVYQGAALATARQQTRNFIFPSEIGTTDGLTKSASLSAASKFFEFGNKVMILPVYSGTYTPSRTIISDINSDHVIPGNFAFLNVIGAVGALRQITGNKVIYALDSGGGAFIFDSLNEYVSL